MVVLLLAGVDDALIPPSRAVSTGPKIYGALAFTGLGLLACCRGRRHQVSQNLSAKSRGASGVSHNPACPQHQGQRRD